MKPMPKKALRQLKTKATIPLAVKVQQVKSVACCITLDRCATVVTGFVVIVGDLQGFLQLQWSFD
jgi:hypothetical protein